jgi:predicted TIM-barrel fold metal-dependent hydrolase
MDGYLPPHKTTKTPTFKVPLLACDCHMHIFGPEADYPYTNPRSFTPHDGSVLEYKRVMKALSLERTVVVQASVYGSDNRRTVDAVEELGREQARGIAMVDANVDRKALQDLNDRGIRGTRFITTVKGGPSLENLPEVAKKIADFGWHIEMYIPPHLWAELLPRISSLPVPVVFDHMGGQTANTPQDSSDLQGMLRLLESGRCWVKLCGYRASIAGHPYSDVEPLAKRFIACAPERCVWGTDWPHTTLNDYMPDDGDLMDLLADWAPDPEVRRKILVTNAEELYDF